MEQWQRDHIKHNLIKLCSYTKCTELFLLRFEKSEILSEEDIQNIKSKGTCYKKSSELYNLLPSRTNSYTILLDALIETRQSGAADILTEMPLEKLETLPAHFTNQVFSLSNLLAAEDIKKVQVWIQKLSCKDRLQLHNTSLHLYKSTIPELEEKEKTEYLPRFFSRRQCLNPKIFSEDCHDVFIFKKGMEFWYLRTLNTKKNIVYSSEELRKQKITNRLILLTSDSHWKLLQRLSSKATAPAHLVRYDAETTEFLLEESTKVSETLYQNLKDRTSSNQNYFSEDDVIKENPSDKTKVVCICGSPYMGKSLLLKNIGKKLVKICPGRVVAFFDLNELALTICPKPDIKSILLEQLYTSELSRCILEILIHSDKICFELLFDGLNEVPLERFHTTLEFLRDITKAITNARIYITSRPVVRKELEQLMKVISYDIEPFNDDAQLQYLTATWYQKLQKYDSNAIAVFAKKCLSSFRQTTSCKSIAGVPLVCELIAAEFFEQAENIAKLGDEFQDDSSKFMKIGILKIYKKYVQTLLGANSTLSCKEQSTTALHIKTCQVKGYHVIYALKLIFANVNQDIFEEFMNFDTLHLKEIFRPAVLQHDTMGKVEFFHRTFAEYLVGEYVAKTITGESPCWSQLWKKRSQMERTILNEFIKCHEIDVLYFVNDFILNCSQRNEMVLKNVKTLSEKDFSVAISNCVRYNYESVMKCVLEIQKNYQITSNDTMINVFQTALNILEYAAIYCNASTYHILDTFCRQYCKFGLFKDFPTTHLKERYIKVVKGVLCQPYEVVKLFVDDSELSREVPELLCHCFENIHLEDPERQDERFDVAGILANQWALSHISKCDNLPPLNENQLHSKVVQFLNENKKEILENGWLEEDMSALFREKLRTFLPYAQ